MGDDWDAIDDVIGDVLQETSNETLGDAIKTPRKDEGGNKMFGFLDDLEQDLAKITLIADEDLNEHEANERLGIKPAAAPVYATANEFKTPEQKEDLPETNTTMDTAAAAEVERAFQEALNGEEKPEESTPASKAVAPATATAAAPAAAPASSEEKPSESNPVAPSQRPKKEENPQESIIVAPTDDLFALAQAKLLQHRTKRKTIKKKSVEQPKKE